MRKAVFAALLVATLAPAVQAAESIVLDEGNVVEFGVITVTVPSRLPNYCTVSALVTHVWQGAAYHRGQPLALNVPCAEYGLMSAKATLDNFTPVNARTLQQSRQGIARLDGNGELIWDHSNLRQYGQWGAVAGYRVLDARMLPAQQRS